MYDRPFRMLSVLNTRLNKQKRVDIIMFLTGDIDCAQQTCVMVLNSQINCSILVNCPNGSSWSTSNATIKSKSIDATSKLDQRNPFQIFSTTVYIGLMPVTTNQYYKEFPEHTDTYCQRKLFNYKFTTVAHVCNSTREQYFLCADTLKL